MDRLNEVLEEHTGVKTATATAKDKEVPEGYVDMNEATLDSHPGLFQKTTAKVE